MKIGIIGGGVVGRATARCFMEHGEVKVYDVVRERATHSKEETLACDLVFVCLPTPQVPGSLECDVSALHVFFNGVLDYHDPSKNFVLRSTVPIGTTKRLAKEYNLPNLVHSPEFLTARCAITDAQVPARNIVGVPNGGSNAASVTLALLYRDRFPGVPIHTMSSDESEAVKLFLNSFFAVKVAYFNEINELAEKLGLDWGRVLEGMLSDGRIAHSHTKVPGPDGKYGFGGTCLPKDLANLISCGTRNNFWFEVTQGAYSRNMHDRERKAK